MLGKLFKYEMKATAKLLIPIYIAFIAICGITRISLEFQIEENSPFYFLTDIGILIFTISIMSIFIITAIVIVWRFYRNTSSDEGYLIFTLPVKTDYIILSEFLCGIFWCIVMAAVFIIGMFLILINIHIDGAVVDFAYLGSIFSSLSAVGIKAIFVTLINILISALVEIMTVYCAISIASLFRKYRLLLSAVFYIALVVIINFFDIIVLRIFEPALYQEVDTITSFTDTWNNSIAPSILSMATFIDTVYIIVIMFIEYFVTRNILKRHLNID